MKHHVIGYGVHNGKTRQFHVDLYLTDTMLTFYRAYLYKKYGSEKDDLNRRNVDIFLRLLHDKEKIKCKENLTNTKE